MSIECCQRSPPSLPPLPPSSSSPVHSVGGHHPPSLDAHYPFQLVAEIASNQQSRSTRVGSMTRTDLGGDSAVSAGTAATTTAISTTTANSNSSRPQIPPRPAGSKPVPPPRRSSAVSSSTSVTSNDNNNNTTLKTTSSEVPNNPPEPSPKHESNKASTEPSSEASPPPYSETTGSVSHASTSSSSTPRVIKWGRNFTDLINDKEGLDLFTKFLRQEAQSEDLINFHFTCESITCPENRSHRAKLARAIIRKYIISNPNNGNCSVGSFLSEGVKSKLVQEFKKLNQYKADREDKPDQTGARSSRDDDDANNNNNNNNNTAAYTDEFYTNLFKDAQTEIFNLLSGHLYEHFIRHDIYLRHLSEITFTNEQTIVYSEAPNAEASPSPSNGSLFDGANSMENIDSASQLPPSYDSLRQCESALPYDYSYRLQPGFSLSTKPLPTVSEQDETGSTVDLKSDDEVASTMAVDVEVSSSYQQMFHNVSKETTSRYLASAEDSGIETQVSLVPSERTANRNRNHSGKSRSHSPTIGMNTTGTGTTTTITSLGRGVNFQRVLNHNRNELIDDGIKYQSAKVTMTQEMFHQSYLNSKQQMAQGYPAPHPYHVSSFSVVPPSTRDSEIQSISSNSTSESYALNYSRDRNHHPKQPTASKSNPNFPPNALRNALNAHAFKHPSQGPHPHPQPDTSKVPDPTTKPEAFASLLCKKLRAILHESATQNQFIHKLREVEKESETAGYNQGLKDALKNKKFNLKPPDDKDDQSILDNHCAQVFDMTPSNSGTPTTAVQPPNPQTVPPVVVVGGGASAPVTAAYQHHHHHHPHHQQQTGHPYGAYRGMPAPAASGLHQHYPGLSTLSRLQNLSLSSNPSLLSGNNSIYLGPNQVPPPAQESSSVKAGDMTVTVSFSDDPCPYRLTLPRQPNVTLAQFKAAIPTKKGKVYLHFFKRKCTPLESVELNSPFVLQAIDDDAAVLPQYDGKIFAKAELQP